MLVNQFQVHYIIFYIAPTGDQAVAVITILNPTIKPDRRISGADGRLAQINNDEDKRKPSSY